MELAYQLAKITFLLVSLALLFLAGQGVLFVLAGRGRDRNLFYQLFQILTKPVFKIVRAVTPGVILDRHVPLVAVLLLAWLWILLSALVIPDLACRLDRIECPTRR